MDSLSIEESPTRQSCLAELNPATQCVSNFPPQDFDGLEILTCEKSQGEGSMSGTDGIVDGIPAAVHDMQFARLPQQVRIIVSARMLEALKH